MNMSNVKLLTHFGRSTFLNARNQQVIPTAVASISDRFGHTFNSSTSNRRCCYTNQFGGNKQTTWPSLRTVQLECLHNFSGSQCKFGTKNNPDRAGKSETKSSAAVTESVLFGESSNLGLFAKFKLMYKKYWYVLIPVHVVTSVGWYGAFYYLSKSGVDVPSLLQYIHLSETIIQKVQNSDMGHLAIAYLCYKVATPLRYAVTLGGTTVAIKHLVQTGYIKPLPSKQEIMNMYEQKKADRAAAKAEKETDKTKCDDDK